MNAKTLCLRENLVFPVLLFSLLCLSSALQAQMRQIYLDTSDSTNQINKLSYFSASQGFVAFQDWVGYTADSGKSFTQKPITNSNVNYNGNSVNLTFGFQILGVKAFDQNTVICYGDYGLVPGILYSTDGGTTYTLVFQSQYNPNQLSTGITDMIFPQNDNVGFAVDADRILKTTDKGMTWSVIATYPGSFFDYLEAVDDNHVYAISIGSHSNKVVATTNSGSSWQQLVLPSGSLNYADFVSANNGWVDLKDANGNGYVYYTSTAGASWTLKNNVLATSFPCFKMKFINDSVGYATGYVFQVYKTMDSGKVWEPLPRDNSFTFYGFSFNDLQYWSNGEIWAGGAHGFLELGMGGGGTSIPMAYFLIDTSGLSVSGTVHLNNYSRPNYTCKWLRNDTLFSTSFNASYAHASNRLKDTIMLIVSNGSQADTLIQFQSFYPPVTITSFSPTAGALGTVVTINGSNFTGATSVSFGGIPASAFTVVSDGVIQATVGGGASGAIVVGTPTGAGQIAGFVFVMAPTLSSFSPQSGIAGTTVTILGGHLTGTTQVLFGVVPASSFTVVSDGEITAVPASGSTGSVEVINAGGTATLAGWIELPFMRAFFPMTGSNGAQVILTGTGFTSVSAVSFGGVGARSYVVNSSTSITAIVGGGATGNVVVTTANGAVSLPGFIYVQGPGGVSFSPLSGPEGMTVTISGNNFSPTATANTVYFGQSKATVVAASPTSLTVKVPTGATYSPVSVTTNGLTAVSSRSFLPTFPGGGSITPQSFGPDQDYAFNLQYSGAGEVVGDIDGDGKPDIVQAGGSFDIGYSGINIARNTGSPGNISFDLRAGYLPAYGITQVALVDVDGDGQLELLGLSNDTIFVFANQSTPGNIVFGPPAKIIISTGASAFAVGDIDGDGRPDLVVSSGLYYPDLYTVALLNTSSPGSVSFGSPIATSFPTFGAGWLVFADLNGDGKQDIVVSYAPNDSLAVYTNNSTVGNIALTHSLSLAATEPTYIVVRDVDGDGRPDILTVPNGGSPSTSISIFLNTGGGSISFAPRVDLPVETIPAEISIADMDGDGKADVVVTSDLDTMVRVIKNESTAGNLAFASPVAFSSGFRGAGEAALELVDMDGDGKTDIFEMNLLLHLLRNTVTAQPFIQNFSPTIGVMGTVVTIKGNNFSGATAVTIGGVGASFAILSDSVISATVGSGATGNIAVTNPYGTDTGGIFVYGSPPSITSVAPLSGPVGTSVTITGSNFGTSPSANVVYFGQMQAAVTAATSTSLVVTVPFGTTYEMITVTTGQRTAYYTKPFVQTFPGGGAPFGAGTFAPDLIIPNTNTSGNPNVGQYQFGQLADIDGDGKLDILTSFTTVLIPNIQVSRNTSVAGRVGLDKPVTIGTHYSQNFVVGDIDGDGKPDIIAGNSDNSFSFYQNLSTPGNIQFAANLDFSTGAPDEAPEFLAIGDLDHDGKPDVITLDYEVMTLSIFRNISNNAQVLFDTPIVYHLPYYPFNVKIGDLDGDGLLDIAVGTVAGVSVFRNTSLPARISFAGEQDFASGSVSCCGGVGLFIGDIDGDGKPDLTSSNQYSNLVSTFRNTSIAGSVSFAPVVNTTVSGGPRTVMIADLDGDGKPDVATANPVGQYSAGYTSISIFKNAGESGSLLLQPQVQYACLSPTYGGIGDLDGDGKPDVAVWGDGGLTVFRNEVGEPAPSFAPQAGFTGQTITISGAGFALANKVSFGNSPALSFQVNSDTSMMAVVGSGASGNLVIETPSDTIVMPGFVYLSTPTIRSTAGTAICTGSTDTLVSSGSSNNQWYKDGVMLINDTASRLAVSDSGVYTVVETFDGVTTPFSTPYMLALTPIPPTPVISQDSNVLISSADSGNQWYMDTTDILSGVTGKQYTPEGKGYYSVKVTLNGCSSPFSVPFDFIPPPPPPPPPQPPTTGGNPATDTVQLVPNPFTSYVSIQFNQSTTLTLQVTDIMGDRLLVATNVRNGDKIDLAWLRRGYYFIKIWSDDGQVNTVRPVLKL
jgi:photosystem II stability/assembly factor-like uncharacterized protein